MAQQKIQSDAKVRRVIPVEDVVPSLFRYLFPFDCFNEVQSACLDTFYSDNNMVISSPTGSKEKLP